MRHRWLLLCLLTLFLPLHAERAAAAPDEDPALTILYTANTFGKQQPCPV
jgi:hypothetical protein